MGNKYTKLQEACIEGNLKEVKKSLKKDPELINIILRAKDGNSQGTALMYSSSHGHVEIVKYLLSLPDIDVNLQNQKGGLSALHYACAAEKIEVIRLLISDPRIDANIKNQSDETPLEYATSQGKSLDTSTLCENKLLSIDQIHAESTANSTINISEKDVVTSDTIDPPNREPVTEESIFVEPTTSIVMEDITSVEQELSPINQSQAHQIDYKLIESMRDQSALLLFNQQEQKNLLTLAQASSSSLIFLKNFGIEREGAEREYRHIQSHPDLYEFYLTFVRSVSGVAMAHLSVLSKVIADGRTTRGEDVLEILTEFVRSSNLPGGGIVLTLGFHLLKRYNDRDRNLTLQRLTRSFPSITALEWIETLSRKVTLLLEDEMTAQLRKTEKKSAGMKGSFSKRVEWLQDARNKSLPEKFAEERAAILLDKMMKTDPAESVTELRVLVKLLGWTLERSVTVDQIRNCLIENQKSDSSFMSSEGQPSLVPVSSTSPESTTVTHEEIVLKLSQNEATIQKLTEDMAKVLQTQQKKAPPSHPTQEMDKHTIAMGNMMMKQKESIAQESSQLDDGSHQSITITEKRFERLEIQIAQLEQGMVEVIERVDEIDTRVDELERLNESLRLNPEIMVALKKIGVKNEEDLKYVYTHPRQMKAIEGELSPINYERFEEAKNQLFSRYS